MKLEITTLCMGFETQAQYKATVVMVAGAFEHNKLLSGAGARIYMVLSVSIV